MDDLTQKVLNEIPEPETEETESPTVEKNDTEVQETESPASETESQETVEQPTEDADQRPKKGAEKRIRELNSQVKQERAKNESLSRQIEALTGSGEPQGLTPPPVGYDPNKPLIAPGEEVTPEEFSRRQAIRDQWLLRQADNNARFREMVRETTSRISQESKDAEQSYPQLNPDSPEYDEELANSVSQGALAFVRANPTGSLKQFVDGLMKPYQRSLDKSVASRQGEIAKQASQSALRPNQIPSTDKKAEDMSIDELEKKLGVVY